MRFPVRALAAVLACLVGVQPVVGQVVSAQVQGGSVAGGQAGASVSAAVQLRQPAAFAPLQVNLSPSSVLPVSPSLHPSAPIVAEDHRASGAAAGRASARTGSLAGSPAAPLSLPGAAIQGRKSLPTAVSGRALKPAAGRRVAAIERMDPAGRPGAGQPGQEAPSFEARVGEVAARVAEAGEDIAGAAGDGLAAAAGRQFKAITGEAPAGEGTVADPVPVKTGEVPGQASQGRLQPAESARQAAAAETKAADGAPGGKARVTQVFRDPERNKSFWRFLLGQSVFMFGFQMYMVGLPYLVSSLAKNSLSENRDPRLADGEAVKALIRENRSLGRIAHWVAQAFSYATVPLFMKDQDAGPGKWLTRSFLIRAGVLTLIPTLFFASGLFSFQAAFLTLFGLIAAQSYFQGISVTTEAASTTRLFGDKSVTPEERTKANAILTFVSAAISIIAPAIAGQIALIKDFMGKTGVGGAVIYGIYAAATGIAGLVFASIKLFRGRSDLDKAGAAGTDAAGAGKARPSLKGVVKDLFSSLKDGVKLVLKNRFLRTMLGLNLIASLFSDPLVFNVLPEFVEGLIKSNPGSIGAIMNVPVLGWLLQGLTGTAMGYFALMAAGASVGSIVASLLVDPLRKLFKRLGFKSEESLTIPFYIMAALEVPLFWAMIFAPSMWAVLGLYALQALAVGFAGIAVSGLSQKALGSYSSPQVSKILAAQSFVGIVAAIISTYLYGFVLTDIPIATALLIAAVATTVLGGLRLAAPWLFFSREQRRSDRT